MSARRKRWTAAAIRKATAFPKPQGAIAAAYGGDGDTTRETALLRHIVAYGDVIDTEHVLVDGGVARGRWLLVPLPLAMLDELAEFEAAHADLEPDVGDFEPGSDKEHDVDAEPSLGARLELDQRGWGSGDSSDREEDPAEHGEIETDMGQGDDEPIFPSYQPGRDTVPLLAPVYEANGDAPVTHTDLSQWRRVE
jgi:hypothetical protein